MRSSIVPKPLGGLSIERRRGIQASSTPPSPTILWKYHPGRAPISMAKVYKEKERRRRRANIQNPTHTHTHQVHRRSRIGRTLARSSPEL
jgi:hypothetical protein